MFKVQYDNYPTVIVEADEFVEDEFSHFVIFNKGGHVVLAARVHSIVSITKVGD